MKSILYTSLDTKQLAALRKTFPSPSIAGLFEVMLYAAAHKYAKNYEGGTWAFLASEDGTTGFMYPLVDQDVTFDVSVEGNYYTNPNMRAIDFGAALSLHMINQLAWQLTDFPELSDQFYRMRDFILDISEGKIEAPQEIDGVAVLGFID